MSNDSTVSELVKNIHYPIEDLLNNLVVAETHFKFS